MKRLLILLIPAVVAVSACSQEPFVPGLRTDGYYYLTYTLRYTCEGTTALYQSKVKGGWSVSAVPNDPKCPAQ